MISIRKNAKAPKLALVQDDNSKILAQIAAEDAARVIDVNAVVAAEAARLATVKVADEEMPPFMNRLDPANEKKVQSDRAKRDSQLRTAATAIAATKETEMKTKKTTAKAPAPVTTSTAKAKGPNIGSVAREAILAGATNEAALAAVMKAFPACQSNVGCMSWYRGKMKRDGIAVPVPGSIAAPAPKAAAPKATKKVAAKKVAAKVAVKSTKKAAKTASAATAA